MAARVPLLGHPRTVSAIVSERGRTLKPFTGRPDCNFDPDHPGAGVRTISFARFFLVVGTTTFYCATLGGCGTYVPQLHEVWEQADVSDPTFVERIKQSIYCELRKAVTAEMGQSAPPNGTGKAIPDDWGAQITLSLEVDETGALSAAGTRAVGIGGPNLFTLGLGGNSVFSSDQDRQVLFLLQCGSVKATANTSRHVLYSI